MYSEMKSVEEIKTIMNIISQAIGEREAHVSNRAAELLYDREINSEDKIRLMDLDLVRTVLSDNLAGNINVIDQLMEMQLKFLRAYLIRFSKETCDEVVLP